MFNSDRVGFGYKGNTREHKGRFNNEVPEPLRATFEMPPAELGDKISNDFDFLRKIY